VTRLAVVAEGVPAPNSGGSAMVNWTIVNTALGLGHDVTVVVLLTRFDVVDPDRLSVRLAALTACGARVSTLPIPDPAPPRSGVARLRSLLAPTVLELYPTAGLGDRVAELLAESRAEAAYVFDHGPIAALSQSRPCPAFAVFGDPLHLVARERFRNELGPSRAALRSGLTWLGVRRVLPPWIVSIAARYEACGWYGAQHARWLAGAGVACEYLPVPVADEAATTAKLRGDRPTVLMLWGGTASVSGLRLLRRKLLPALDVALGPDGYRFQLAGRPPNIRPEEIAELSAHPAVEVRGFVDDLGTLLAGADVFLFPSRYPVGIRTRIVAAMSFGCCVVTDPSSRLGAPELKDRENVLMAGSSEALAPAIVEALTSPALRERIGSAARRTYEERFAPAVAARRIVDRLAGLAG
jgi:Glycosyl transferases group 1